jgi:flagellar secretion chaperone FliS
MFSPVSMRAASAYKRVGVETSVEGANPHQLVRLLFDALLQSLASAKAALKRGDIEVKGREIGKSVRILQEGLIASLNQVEGGEVSVNLRGVYGYSVRTLTVANLKNDEGKLTEVIGLIETIADAWKQIGVQPTNVQKLTGA